MSTALVFSGGGVRTNYALGCIQQLKKQNSPLFVKTKELSGISAGAIVAASVATGCDLDDCYDMMATSDIVDSAGT